MWLNHCRRQTWRFSVLITHVFIYKNTHVLLWFNLIATEMQRLANTVFCSVNLHLIMSEETLKLKAKIDTIRQTVSQRLMGNQATRRRSKVMAPVGFDWAMDWYWFLFIIVCVMKVHKIDSGIGFPFVYLMLMAASRSNEH